MTQIFHQKLPERKTLYKQMLALNASTDISEEICSKQRMVQRRTSCSLVPQPRVREQSLPMLVDPNAIWVREFPTFLIEKGRQICSSLTGTLFFFDVLDCVCRDAGDICPPRGKQEREDGGDASHPHDGGGGDALKVEGGLKLLRCTV